jgi:hypothetical protein
VRLGVPEWSRYTYARPEGDALRLLGSVRRGPQMGALAMTENGQYVQVVGDYVTPLNSSQLTRAMTKVKPEEPSYPVQKTVSRVGPPPVVTIKRRRTYVPV